MLSIKYPYVNHKDETMNDANIIGNGNVLVLFVRSTVVTDAKGEAQKINDAIDAIVPITSDESEEKNM